MIAALCALAVCLLILLLALAGTIVRLERAEHKIRLLRLELGAVATDASLLGSDHRELVQRLATTDTPTRVEFQNLQDAVDNLEQAEQARTNLNILHAAQLSQMHAELTKMRLDPYFGYKGKDN